MLRRYKPINTGIIRKKYIQCNGFVVMNFRISRKPVKNPDISLFDFSELLYKQLYRLLCCNKCKQYCFKYDQEQYIDKLNCMFCSINIRSNIERMMTNDSHILVTKQFLDNIQEITVKYNMGIILTGTTFGRQAFHMEYYKGRLIHMNSSWIINNIDTSIDQLNNSTNDSTNSLLTDLQFI